MKKIAQRQGFTLIELLTVIAIIAILSSMTLVGLGRVREKAKIAKVVGTFSQLNTALTAYYASNNTYPPGYGYPFRNASGQTEYSGVPYMARLGLHRAFDSYDLFSITAGHDTNGNGVYDIGEKSPLGNKDPITGNVIFPTFNQNNPSSWPQTAPDEQRPFLYFPVYTKHAQRVGEYFRALAQTNSDAGWYADAWDPSNSKLTGITFPPPRYDAFVLISMGPEENSHGVLPPPHSLNDPNVFYITGLRAYFLATRDANDDGVLDFDFRGRSQGNQADPKAYSDADLNLLPDGTNLGGPMIYVGGS